MEYFDYELCQRKVSEYRAQFEFNACGKYCKNLIIENPDLASPDREAELLEKTNKICIEKYNAMHCVTEQELRTPTRLGYFLQ